MFEIVLRVVTKRMHIYTKNNNKEIIFDVEDAIKAEEYTWIAMDVFKRDREYIVTYIKGKPVPVSKIIFNTKPDEYVVHKNGDPYDFRKINLIICNKKVYGHLTGYNMKEKSSSFYNVQKDCSFWVVEYIQEDGTCIKDVFYNEVDAAYAADYHNILRFGELGLRNFPDYSEERVRELYLQAKKRQKEIRKWKRSKSSQGKKRNGTAKYVGVYKKRNKWTAEITHNYQKYRLGTFQSEIEAAKAYDKKAKELFGENARVNIRD